MEQKLTRIYFSSELSPFLELYLLKDLKEILSKSIWARDLKLGQLIGNDE